MKWLPKQFVLWGTNILQAVAICSSALSIALMMRSSTCCISTAIDTIMGLFFHSGWSEQWVQKCNSKLGQFYMTLSLHRQCFKKKNKKKEKMKGWEWEEDKGLTHMWCPSPPASNTSTLHSYSTCSHNPQLRGHRSWKERDALQTLNLQWMGESLALPHVCSRRIKVTWHNRCSFCSRCSWWDAWTCS